MSNRIENQIRGAISMCEKSSADEYYSAKFKNLEVLVAELTERLESIERMLGEESNPPTSEHACKTCTDTGEINIHMPRTMADSEDIACPDCSYAQKEPEWQTGFPPENKMVVIKGSKGNTHFAYITKQGFYNIFVMDNPVIKEVTRPSSLFEKWREMTKEENTLCWERGILGASEEHAELSTLELPIAKQEPEWRPMSTAPKDGKYITVKFGEEKGTAWFTSALNCWMFNIEGKTGFYPYSTDELSGWRPL